MAIIFTFDLENAQPINHNRIQCAFERFGWENLGGSSYRYPKLGEDQSIEDWFNNVIPALMLFRSYTLENTISLSKFTLDIQTSTGANPKSGFGTVPTDANKITLYKPTNPTHLGEKKLRSWLSSIASP